MKEKSYGKEKKVYTKPKSAKKKLLKDAYNNTKK
tara:strand:- start:6923 stop:7024 length:102 start_codon:yes stop_codon:yes gene_type:complete